MYSKSQILEVLFIKSCLTILLIYCWLILINIFYVLKGNIIIPVIITFYTVLSFLQISSMDLENNVNFNDNSYVVILQGNSRSTL